VERAKKTKKVKRAKRTKKANKAKRTSLGVKIYATKTEVYLPKIYHSLFLDIFYVMVQV
jgi:hypothetical protein